MQVGVRIARLSSSRFRSPHFPLLSTTSRRLRCNLSPSAASPEECELNEESDKFLRWLRQKAGSEISSVLSLGNSIYGRSLFASKNIKSGECILKVPYIAQITSENISREIKLLLPRDIENVSRLAYSGWATYVNSLPSIDEMHNAIFWSKDELELVRDSAIYQETINLQAHIKKEYSVLGPVLEQFPYDFGDVHLMDFMHAYALVTSRAWDTSKGVSLIPFADFLNHDGTCDAVLLSDVHEEISEVIADRDYAVGEQVMIRYGKFSNATLLLDFGFTLPYNKYDQVQLLMDIPSHDPLYGMKSEILKKHCWPRTTTNADKSNTSGNSFVVKEVKSAIGKGKGIPQALRAFARVLSATSVEELQSLITEATENDGRLARRPLKSNEREIQAHCILCSRLLHMIQGHDVALKKLKSVDASDCNGRQSLRTRMARDLLNGELRVMKSAYAWLTNYYTSLSVPKEASLCSEEFSLTSAGDGELG
ncbi:SET domain containing 6 [Musa troglodytarum]|uniref:SET domain containing 6 n=1 Tax=Musa troglodytarum TaxID=320322 RepID=A0A9E7JKG4_9LILI|nr:SET domain containing 6 [Musa troglodytarum]